MTLTVLDCSALVALLRGEPGSERVQAVFPDAAMTTVNLGETVAILAQHGAPEATIRMTLSSLQVAYVPFDEMLAYDAGLLEAVTRMGGLSFGDRACLALARRLGACALTTDRSWAKIAKAVGVDIEVIR